MTQYRDNPNAIRSLVRGCDIHRDVYINPELFDLEMERLWHTAWVYVGHDSQVPAIGDYYTTEVARQPLLMTRAQDGEVRVFYNRCAHRGARVVSAPSGKCGGILRCPYHGWTYRLDGSLRTVPLKGGYTNTGFEGSPAASGLSAVPGLAVHRGFVFARFSRNGPSFSDYFGDSLSSIDNMADRSPAGRLEVVGGTLRYMHNCNWKMFVENLNDAMHPMVAHESSAGTARDLWKDQPPDAPKPMVIEQFLPFVSNYDFFDKMGVKLYENGHSYTGVNFSIHSKYSNMPEYEAGMEAAYGAERARAVLGEIRHNTVYYPSLTVKGAIQTIRVARPLAVRERGLRASHCGWSARLRRCSNVASCITDSSMHRRRWSAMMTFTAIVRYKRASRLAEMNGSVCTAITRAATKNAGSPAPTMVRVRSRCGVNFARGSPR